MATINAINSNKPIEVSKGGTGAVTLSNHGVLIGTDTSPIRSILPASAGMLLVGNTGSDPAFSTTIAGSFSFSTSLVGSGLFLRVRNTDNTSSASHARTEIATGGGSAGDAYIQFTVSGVTDWVQGIDNSSSDAFKISASTSLGTTDTFVMTVNGENTLPLQPAFLAYKSSATADVTGSGTVYTVIFDTEVFDQNADYNNSTGIWTAPVTGRYHFCCNVNGGTGYTANTTEGYVILSTTKRDYYSNYINPYVARTASDYCGFFITALCDMDAGDTAQIKFVVSGEATDVVDVYGAAGPQTYFSGKLAC